MNLNEEEYVQFLTIHKQLLFFAGKMGNFVDDEVIFNEFSIWEAKRFIPIREALYKDDIILNAFVNMNPFKLPAEDLEIAKRFKHHKKGTFYIYKMLKKHNVFLGDKYAYAVSALADSLDYVMGGMPVPIMVEAVLLPYKDKIVYDGFLIPYSIRFGGGIKSRLKGDYDKAIARYGLIETLPINVSGLPEFTEKDQLTLWMKTDSSRNEYWDEIQNLVRANPHLKYYYTSLWSKVFARNYKKNLKENDIKGHFAVYDQSVLASALTKKELEKRVREFLTEEEAEGVYFFKL
jgi:hypothetical protein